jgi:hypothetical protein
MSRWFGLLLKILVQIIFRLPEWIVIKGMCIVLVTVWRQIFIIERNVVIVAGLVDFIFIIVIIDLLIFTVLVLVMVRFANVWLRGRRSGTAPPTTITSTWWISSCSCATPWSSAFYTFRAFSNAILANLRRFLCWFTLPVASLPAIFVFYCWLGSMTVP